MNTSNETLPQQFLNEGYTINDDLDGSDDDDSGTDNQSGSLLLREQDRFLPICNIVKIMKKAIPENGKIAKDARECIQECVSEFISFVTSEAIDKSREENRKTVNGDDIVHAMNVLGFDNYMDPLTLYLAKYRESTKPDRNLVYQDQLFFEDSSNEFKNQTNGDVQEILNASNTDDSLRFYQPGNFSL